MDIISVNMFLYVIYLLINKNIMVRLRTLWYIMERRTFQAKFDNSVKRNVSCN